jgi:S-adenosylmethionine:tRNA ribosyltransferase-isomerase
LKTKDFYYELPKELIAQKPLPERDASRLLVYNRADGTVVHRIFRDIAEYITPNDALVLNDTKVIPARIYGVKEATGAKVEVLLLNRKEKDVWEAIARPGKKLKTGDILAFEAAAKAEVLEKRAEGVILLRFSYEGLFEQVLDRIGQMPLPPYITEKLADKARYQTVYAREEGSAAAPTAGLHFTDALLKDLKDRGIPVLNILLHVGLGTFRPVKAEDIGEHVMHTEYYEVSAETAERYNRVKAAGGRIFAVGTTTVRTLETAADEKGFIRGTCGNTDIFITPGYRFKTVDALITNFHLPESTLLMLVSAFMGYPEAMRVYRTAVLEKYRFFSFGDAMLIL